MRGCMTENESGREKGEDGENREERTAAHGKHMSCMKKLYRDAYTEEKGEVRGVGGCWIGERRRVGGMWRQGRADPVRSAASLVDIKRRDEEKGDFKQRSQRLTW